MINNITEVKEMTNNQVAGLLEAIKIIAEKSESIEEIKDALARIQDVMKNTK